MQIKTICVAGMIIIDKQNRILLQQRTDDSNWCIPGGSIELGESVEEAAVRETLEETGLIIKSCTLFNVYSGKSQYHKYPDGNEYYFVNVVFAANEYEGKLEIDGYETKNLSFFDLNNLPQNISKTNIPILAEVKVKYWAMKIT